MKGELRRSTRLSTLNQHAQRRKHCVSAGSLLFLLCFRASLRPPTVIHMEQKAMKPNVEMTTWNTSQKVQGESSDLLNVQTKDASCSYSISTPDSCSSRCLSSVPLWLEQIHCKAMASGKSPHWWKLRAYCFRLCRKQMWTWVFERAFTWHNDWGFLNSDMSLCFEGCEQCQVRTVFSV